MGSSAANMVDIWHLVMIDLYHLVLFSIAYNKWLWNLIHIYIEQVCMHLYLLVGLIGFMLLNATFNNISAISWRSVLLVEETGVPGENNRSVESHWQTLLHNVVIKFVSVLRQVGGFLRVLLLIVWFVSGFFLFGQCCIQFYNKHHQNVFITVCMVVLSILCSFLVFMSLRICWGLYHCESVEVCIIANLLRFVSLRICWGLYHCESVEVCIIANLLRFVTFENVSSLYRCEFIPLCTFSNLFMCISARFYSIALFWIYSLCSILRFKCHFESILDQFISFRIY